MEAVDLRKNLITTIDGSKEEILKNLETSAQEMQQIKEGTLEARSANEFLNEL